MDKWNNNNNSSSGSYSSGYSAPYTPPPPQYSPRVTGGKQYESVGGFGIVCGLIAYLFGIVGIIVMLCSVQFLYVLPAILVALVLIAPVFVRLVRGASVGAALSACVQYGHYMFTLLVAMWWVLYSSHAAKPGVLIAIGIMTMYAMYYFPFFLAADAAGRGLSGKRCARAAIICFVDSLIFYVVFAALMGDAMSDYVNVMFSTAIVVSGNLQQAINKYKQAKQSGNGVRGLVSVVLVFSITLGSVGVVTLALPKITERRYEQALTLIEEGDYAAAREALQRIINYPAAADKFAEIALVRLEVGETVTLGHHLKHPDKPGRYYALTWTVVEVKEGKALLLCNEILSCMDSNPLSYWNKGNNVRSRLQEVYGAFDDADKAKILQSTITTVAEKGEFVSEDYLFPLSQAELERYCTDEKMMFTKEKGSYYKGQEPYETTLCYYTRTTDAKGKWIVADCENRAFTTRKDESYRLVGVRPAMYISNADTVPASPAQ